MDPDITFRPSAAEKIVEKFGKTVDDEGYIVDKETQERVESNLGNEISIDNFGGVGKGSQVFLEKDYVSVAEFIESKEKQD
ncbi:hypothetical protein [Halococcus thailandensis]|uniref:Uncharacterized protein n=1 Tax=Halococcus thailandensis JCM 13552 TaxID=1227457 RepID=M0N5N1_9EURY|nr:hypothetical protein [Halococcus thailandensis]EMA51985.1 hypothetical protein C451_12949 [Halococcus thailandensis JCM 13552]